MSFPLIYKYLLFISVSIPHHPQKIIGDISLVYNIHLYNYDWFYYNILLRGTITSSRIRCPLPSSTLLCLPPDAPRRGTPATCGRRATPPLALGSRRSSIAWLHAPSMPSHMPCTLWPWPPCLMATAPKLHSGWLAGRNIGALSPVACRYGRAVVVVVVSPACATVYLTDD